MGIDPSLEELRDFLKEDPKLPSELVDTVVGKLGEMGKTHGTLVPWNIESFAQFCVQCNRSELSIRGSQEQLMIIDDYHMQLIAKVEASGATPEVIKRYNTILEECYARKCERFEI